MTPVAFLRPLGALWVLLAGVALFAAFVAVAIGEPHLAPLFATTALIAFIPGVFILAATRGMRSKASALDALGLALLSWITAPAMAASTALPPASSVSIATLAAKGCEVAQIPLLA